jgi:hypothetical protein
MSLALANLSDSPIASMDADECDDMAWTKLSYPRDQVNGAARALVAYEQMDGWDVSVWNRYIEGLPVINNWRSSHSFPLNTFRTNLNRSAGRIDSEVITAQRIKRLSSISQKLQRFPSMKLSQMQDIGGCRAVLRSNVKIQQPMEYYRKSQVKYKLTTVDDYILHPKHSGYRGVHLIWQYHSDRSQAYNTLKIEMQLRLGYCRGNCWYVFAASA